MKAERVTKKPVYVFAGPTLAPSEKAKALLRSHKLKLRPPAKRGDIERLAARAEPAVMVVVDGVFHDELAVGHAELRDALASGWQIWGLSSMGAIRAREMQPFGMRGFGAVFQRFVDEDDFQDDEVALLHETVAPFRSVTEPLVHLREALADLTARGLVTAAEEASIVAELKSKWYGDRTIRGTIEMVRARRGKDSDWNDLRSVWANFDSYRRKTQDLERFLETTPWLAKGKRSR